MIDCDPFCGIAPEAEDNGHPDEVTVHDMKKALGDPKLGIKVIGVREADEYEIAKVDGRPLLPLSQLQQRFTELDPNQYYYLSGKVGVRSLNALSFLRQQGFKDLKRAQGGITALGRRRLIPKCPDIDGACNRSACAFLPYWSFYWRFSLIINRGQERTLGAPTEWSQ